MKKLIFLIFLISIVTGHSQETENSTAIKDSRILKLRNKIANFGQVQSSHIGFGGIPSKQYENYQKLLSVASNNELFELTKDTSAVVVTYALYGLIERKDKRFVKSFQYFLENDRKVETMKGCVISDRKISEEIYFAYFYDLYRDLDFNDSMLDKDPLLMTLDSLTLHSGNAPKHLYYKALENREYGDSYENLLVKLAFKKHHFLALKYLHEKKEDKYKEQIETFLVDYLNKTQKISVFDLDIIYEVLISYKKPDINQLLFSILKDIDQMHGERTKYRYKNLLYKHGITK